MSWDSILQLIEFHLTRALGVEGVWGGGVGGGGWVGVGWGVGVGGGGGIVE
jgi:hypothetical protein